MSIGRRSAAQLADLQKEGLARRCPTITARDGVRYRLDGRPVVGFCSNDYLGLATERMAVEAKSAGASASRLISGDLPEHRHLERQLADVAQAPDAVVFPSGFQLNVGVLPVLLRPEDLASSDLLNHASLIDGMRLAPAQKKILAHLQAPDPLSPSDGVHWWVTESIFSMDGDRLDLEAFGRHRAGGGATFVDEAHAMGLFDGGAGLTRGSDAVVGTLSKAFGAAGAFVAADEDTCELIRTRARSFVFSTGLSPILASQLTGVVERVRGPDGDARRRRLWELTDRLAERLGARPAPSPIFPIVTGSNESTLSIASALLERGWHVQPIRPPTVPPGTARLRITVTAGHDEALIDAFAADLSETLDHAGRPLLVQRGLEAKL